MYEKIRILFYGIFFVLTALCAKQAKPLYKMQEKSKAAEEVSPNGESRIFIVGTSKGLFKLSRGNSFFPVWTEGSVEQIVRTEIPSEDGKIIENWYFRTSKGILLVPTLRFLNTEIPACRCLQ